MEQFIMGAIGMACYVVVIYFLRFWRETGDRLFVLFAVAFGLLGVTRLGLAWAQQPAEETTGWYWVRLAAFLVLLVAIIDKNRR